MSNSITSIAASGTISNLTQSDPESRLLLFAPESTAHIPIAAKNYFSKSPEIVGAISVLPGL
jgi:hypothetical protein